MIINPFLSFGGGGWAFPAIADDNSTFNDEGDSTTGWTGSNATVAVSGDYLRETKTSGGTSSSMSKSITFTGTDLDYIIYGKVRSSTGSSHIGVVWILNGAKEVSIWFGSANASTTYTGGAVSICGTTGASTRNVSQAASGLSYDSTPVEFALQFDKKFSTLNCYFKESGRWQLKTRVACDWFTATQIQVLNTTGSPAAAWTEFDHLSLCKPNIIAIGDSVCEGKTLFSPDRGLALSNYLSTWMSYADLYPARRNNLVVNKGVGSQSSATIAARIVADATNHGPRVVFLHASSNDEALAVSLATRTTNIQNSVDDIIAGSAECVLLNSMYGTDAGPDNTPTNDLRDYMLDWWSNYLSTVTDIYLALDIMQPVIASGFQDPAVTQADGIHPTPTGYQQIADYIA